MNSLRGVGAIGLALCFSIPASPQADAPVHGQRPERLVILNATLDSQRGDHGCIEWTIKDGIPYHAPTLFREVREMVEQASR